MIILLILLFIGFKCGWLAALIVFVVGNVAYAIYARIFLAEPLWLSKSGR